MGDYFVEGEEFCCWVFCFVEWGVVVVGGD